MFAHHLRLALRTLRRTPWFTLGVALTLGLGIGANTAIFTISDALLNRPLDFPEQDRLISILERKPQGSWSIASAATYLDWGQSTSTESMAAYAWWDANLSGIGDPIPVKGYRVTPGFFEVLGATPAAGRGFMDAEGEPGGEEVVVLSYDLAQKLFQGSQEAVGSTLRLNGQVHAVVGVMPVTFRFPVGGTELWVPLALGPEEQADRDARYLSVVAKLKPGISFERAEAELTAITEEVARKYPETNRGWGVLVRPLVDLVVGPVRPFVLLLTGVVGFVLLIACVNVAILQFARASGRQVEIATRSSLGASRPKVVHQLLVESVVVSMLGGAFAWGLGYLAVTTIRANTPVALSRWLSGWSGVEMNWKVFAFTLAVALVCGVACGLAPALQLSRTDLSVSMKGSTTVGGSRRSRRWQEALVVAEVVLAVALLVGTGVMVDAFRTLVDKNKPFAPEQVLAAHMVLSGSRYGDPREAADFYERLVAEARALPGATDVAAVNYMPFADLNGTTAYVIDGDSQPPGVGKPRANLRSITPGFFETLRIPLKRGRTFTETDRADSTPVAIVSERFAARAWPNRSPLGERVKAEDSKLPDRWLTVVGVAPDVRHSWLETEIQPTLYMPMSQSPGRRMDVLVRVAGDPMSLAELFRRIVTRLDPDQPVHSLRTMEQAIQEVMMGLSFVVVLMMVASGVALLLATIGIYSVTTYLVRERSREMGIRVAVGAAPRQIVRLFMGRSLRLMAVGLLLGSLGGIGLAKLIGSLVYGVQVLNPVTLIAVLVTLTLSAVLASYVPARSLAGADPMLALRME
jgi:putative ABC transport system permease protein